MISFKTPDPQLLLASLKLAIRQRRIETWSEVGDDFTHTPSQWARKAFLRPSILVGELRFSIIKPQNLGISTEVYAVYHGRFVEAMLAHFDRQFSDVIATALATNSDRIAA